MESKIKEHIFSFQICGSHGPIYEAYYKQVGNCVYTVYILTSNFKFVTGKRGYLYIKKKKFA